MRLDTPGISLSITYIFWFVALASARMLSAEVLSSVLHAVVISTNVEINKKVNTVEDRYLRFADFFIMLV